MPTQPTDYQPKKAKKAKVKLTRSTQPEEAYAPSAWAQSKVGSTFDLRVPSGQLCKIQQLSLQDVIFKGLADSLDLVTSTINDLHVSGKKGKPTKADVEKAGLKLLSGKDRDKIFKTIDDVVLLSVVAPVISPLPGEDEKRDPDKIYIDMVQLDDKMYIFKIVMADIEEAATFREGPTEDLGRL